MGELHRLGHLVGTDLLRRSPSSSSSAATETIGLGLKIAHRHEPLLLRHKFSWKHLQEPADSGRLEEFNLAVARLEPDHMDANSAASRGVERRSNAGISCAEVPGASEKVAQVASLVALAVQSENVAHADSRKAAAADVGGGGLKKKQNTRRLDSLCRPGHDSEKGRDHAPPAKTDDRAGDEAGSACANYLNVIIRSPSGTAMATIAPADVIFGNGNRTDPAIQEYHQVPAPGSGEICAGDQETDPSSSPDSFAELAPSSHTKAAGALEHSSVSTDDAANGEDIPTNHIEAHLQMPAQASGSDQDSGPSSPNPCVERSPPSHIKPCDASMPPMAMAPSFAAAADDIDLHSLGERTAMEMDEGAIRSEVGRQFSVHRHQEQRPKRRVQRRAVANAAPVKFSLRLPNEEAMEDVAAVSAPKDVKPEAGAPARDHNRKRRRGG
ncbi:hypothetical protein VPH35_037431 [Triticum aestivum]